MIFEENKENKVNKLKDKFIYKIILLIKIDLDLI